MSQDKQMKAVSPLLQQVINISSIRRWGWEFDFLYMGLSGWSFTFQGNPLCLYPAGRYLGATSLYLFTDFTDCRPYHSWGLDLGGWCLYLRPHHRYDLQLYRHRDWLCHYLLSGAPLWGCLCPVCRQQAYLMISTSVG